MTEIFVPKDHKVFGACSVKEQALSEESKKFQRLRNTCERTTLGGNIVYDTFCEDGTYRVLLAREGWVL
jgi:hypothetical protein